MKKIYLPLLFLMLIGKVTVAQTDSLATEKIVVQDTIIENNYEKKSVKRVRKTSWSI